jgi:hypothetical protein
VRELKQILSKVRENYKADGEIHISTLRLFTKLLEEIEEQATGKVVVDNVTSVLFWAKNDVSITKRPQPIESKNVREQAR